MRYISPVSQYTMALMLQTGSKQSMGVLSDSMYESITLSVDFWHTHAIWQQTQS